MVFHRGLWSQPYCEHHTTNLLSWFIWMPVQLHLFHRREKVAKPELNVWFTTNLFVVVYIDACTADLFHRREKVANPELNVWFRVVCGDGKLEEVGA